MNMSIDRDNVDGEGQWAPVVKKNKKQKKQGLPMKGAFWNIRELNQPERNLSVGHIVRENRLDFIGIQET
jgi:hypothetical protein